jgi:hypothetical protein
MPSLAIDLGENAVFITERRRTMERKHPRVSLLGISVIAIGLLIGPASTAKADGPHHKPCSNATLDGSYGYYRTGTILPDGGPLVAVGIFNYDGKGHTVGSESVNRNGEYAFDQGGTGFYHVNSDCTGVLLNDDGEEYSRLVVVDGGKTVYLFSENNAVYVVATKM